MSDVQGNVQGDMQGDVQELRVMQAQMVPVAMLWFGVLGGPVAWLVRLIVSYALVPVVCVQDWPLGMHGASALFFAIALAATLVADRSSRKLRSTRAERARQNAEVEAIDSWTGQRAFFMAHLGLLMSGLFTAVILAEWVTAFFISPCVVR